LGVSSPYAKLIRGTMWEWFIKGVLRKNYTKFAKCGTIMKNPKHNLPKLEKYLALQDEMVVSYMI
jgi:hypothetical protein